MKKIYEEHDYQENPHIGRTDGFLPAWEKPIRPKRKRPEWEC